MSRRTSPVRRNEPELILTLGEASETASNVNVSEAESIATIALPRDHPKWARDRFTITSATKALLDRFVPIAIRVFGFWDHRVHRLAMDGGTIEIDASGSYRCDTRLPGLENGARGSIGS